MATSTLIRSLEAADIHPRSLESFIASATIVAGDALSLDYDAATDREIMLKVLPLDSADATAKDFIGVAMKLLLLVIASASALQVSLRPR